MFRGNIKAKRRFYGAIYQSTKKPDNNVEPDEPDTPAAPLYLYGTPSESGNIGLRSGENVVYYDGVIAPPLPVVDGYEHMFIPKSRGLLGDLWLHLSTEITYGKSGSGEWCFGYEANTLQYSYWDGNFPFEGEKPTDWGEPYVHDRGGLYGSPETVLWSNTDLLNEDGSIGHAKTDPIPVSGIVGYSYNGTVLPDISTVYTDEVKAEYPNAFLIKQSETSANHLLYLSTVQLVRRAAEGVQYMESDTNGSVIAYKLQDTGWERYPDSDHEITPNDNFYFWEFVVIYWSNFDIFNNDGTAHVVASDPIPVYE